MHQISIKGTVEQQIKYSQYAVRNAFHAVNFGGQDCSLSFATLPDILHVVRKGIVEWSTKTVLNHFTDKARAELDILAIKFKNNHRQKHKQTFPKISFSSGFTNLSKVQASEWVGILYLMCILVQKDKGWDIINNALIKGSNGETSDVLYIFELILCFDAWINKTTFWSTDDNDAYIASGQQSIKKMMHDIKKYLPQSCRKQG